ncbi:hypothetical protein D4R75_14165 [bacterium]|nr:MAG: hypothetical protein D4R75_14165 [bacterium]
MILVSAGRWFPARLTFLFWLAVGRGAQQGPRMILVSAGRWFPARLTFSFWLAVGRGAQQGPQFLQVSLWTTAACPFICVGILE